MRFHSSISDQESAAEAVARVIDEARQGVAGRVDAAFVFFTARHREAAERIVERVWLELDPQAVIGCSAEGVIGGEREIERGPGVALLVADLGEARTQPFHVPARGADRRRGANRAPRLRAGDAGHSRLRRSLLHTARPGRTCWSATTGFTTTAWWG